MTKSYRSSLIFRVMMPTRFSCVITPRKHVPDRAAVTAVTNFAIGASSDARSACTQTCPRRGAPLKNEEREPDHREGDEHCRDRGRCEEQRLQTFRRNPAQHGVLAWLIRGAPKSPYSTPLVSEPGHTPRSFAILLGRARRGKLSTGADGTSPAGLPWRMLPPLGWGEAALDVRFVSAHQGRRLTWSL